MSESVAPVVAPGTVEMSVGTTDRVGQQDERTLLAEVRLLFGAVDPWLVEFMRAATARGSASAPPGRRTRRTP